MQVYDGVEILTNQPGADERAEVPHHLVGYLPMAKTSSVGAHAPLAQAAVDAAAGRGATAARRRRDGPLPARGARRPRSAARGRRERTGTLGADVRRARRGGGVRRARASRPARGGAPARERPAARRARPRTRRAGRKPGAGADRLWGAGMRGRRSSPSCRGRARSCVRASGRAPRRCSPAARSTEVRALREAGVEPSPTAARILGLAQIGAYLTAGGAGGVAAEITLRTGQYARRQETWARRIPEAIELAGADGPERNADRLLELIVDVRPGGPRTARARARGRAERDRPGGAARRSGRGALPCPPGVAVERLGNALVARVGERDDAVALVGHLDTVPLWDGHEPQLEGTRVIGRGAADMKGGDAAILAVLERVRQHGAPRSSASSTTARRARTARTASTPCWRSRSCSGGRRSRSSASPRAATFMRVASASSTPISSSTAGRRTARAHGRATTRCCAPCRSSNGRRQVAQRPVVVEGLTFHDTLCITQIHGGVARNVVPDRVELALNVRFAPGREAAAARGRDRASSWRARAS